MAVVDCSYLQNIKLKEKVPIAYCTDERNIHKVQLFIPAILVCIGKKQWELMDENDDHMEQIEWDGDHGIGNMVGMYLMSRVVTHARNSAYECFESHDEEFSVRRWNVTELSSEMQQTECNINRSVEE